ncbi:hypothetical protein DdX_03661 [Ditylenchus destructor]|uniref:Uncharacterized protein n=1 Tax=Ditylenchus destructor TaxID=166010 RepID=A0AAD4NCX3_9BILA|nr:hypothetical protein DdX_03661 [Ditylenchus destructor]
MFPIFNGFFSIQKPSCSDTVRFQSSKASNGIQLDPVPEKILVVPGNDHPAVPLTSSGDDVSPVFLESMEASAKEQLNEIFNKLENITADIKKLKAENNNLRKTYFISSFCLTGGLLAAIAFNIWYHYSHRSE